jgi:hypothetical protein
MIQGRLSYAREFLPLILVDKPSIIPCEVNHAKLFRGSCSSFLLIVNFLFQFDLLLGAGGIIVQNLGFGLGFGLFRLLDN